MPRECRRRRGLAWRSEHPEAPPLARRVPAPAAGGAASRAGCRRGRRAGGLAALERDGGARGIRHPRRHAGDLGGAGDDGCRGHPAVDHARRDLTRAGSVCSASRSSAEARWITRITVAERAGSTPARCHCQEGTRRHCCALGGTRIPCGAGPGASSPTQRSRALCARTASMAVTRCSSTDTTARSSTVPVAGSRSPGCSCRARVRGAGSCPYAGEDSNAVQSSAAPTQRGAFGSHASAPGPQASASTSRSSGFVSRSCGTREKRALTDSPFHRAVIHTQSSPSTRTVGSSAPRASTRRVCARCTGAAGVQRAVAAGSSGTPARAVVLRAALVLTCVVMTPESHRPPTRTPRRPGGTGSRSTRPAAAATVRRPRGTLTGGGPTARPVHRSGAAPTPMTLRHQQRPLSNCHPQHRTPAVPHRSRTENR